MTSDFRTDFVSPPTAEMVAAMVEAAGQKPSFGLTDDPTVGHLETKAAAMLGKEAALFCPTCTMCNQIAIFLRCRPGEAVLAEENTHIFLGESGSLAALSGAMAVRVPGSRGAIDLERLSELLRGKESQRSRSALIVTENTHVNLGGTVLPADHCDTLGQLASRWGIAVHLDGARIFNAAAAQRCSAAELAKHAETVAVSLNKGLGAPMGAVLAGPRDIIEEAVHVRQLFGGGWRPANILAAAGIVALDTMVERLVEDQASAFRLGEGLASCPGIEVDIERLESNIVFADVSSTGFSAAEFAEHLKAFDILAFPASVSPEKIVRFVTHHGIARRDVDDAINACQSVARQELTR